VCGTIATVVGGAGAGDVIPEDYESITFTRPSHF
jgi:hypothetical protein